MKSSLSPRVEHDLWLQQMRATVELSMAQIDALNRAHEMTTPMLINPEGSMDKLTRVIECVNRFLGYHDPRARLYWRLADKGWPHWAAQFVSDHLPARWIHD